MTKADFIQKVSAKAGLTKKDTSAAVDAVLDTITDVLSAGDSMTFVGFGTFGITERAARTIKVPGTGKKMDIPSRKAVKFRVGKKLKEAVSCCGKKGKCKKK